MIASDRFGLRGAVSAHAESLHIVKRHEQWVLFVAFFQFLNVCEKFVLGSPSSEVMAKHLEGSLGWFAANPEADEQTRDECCVHLDRDTVSTVGQ